MIDQALRERLVADVLKLFQESIAEGEFSPKAMIESEAQARAWVYCQAVLDTGTSRPTCDQMQAELAEMAASDPIWRRAAVIAGGFIVQKGLAVHPDLGQILSESLSGKTSGNPGGRPSDQFLFHRNRRVLEAVEMLSNAGCPQRGQATTQQEAFEIVAEVMRKLHQRPIDPAEIARIFWQARGARDGEKPLPDMTGL